MFQSSPIGLSHRLLLNNENMEFSRRQVIAGQAAYVKKLVAILKKLSYNNGVGVWWWEGLATHVVRNNQVVWDSGMTNSTLVDASGKALPALASLK